MTSNYQKVKGIILKLNQEELLKNKIIIVGGTVPYLVSKKDINANIYLSQKVAFRS